MALVPCKIKTELLFDNPDAEEDLALKIDNSSIAFVSVKQEPAYLENNVTWCDVKEEIQLHSEITVKEENQIEQTLKEAKNCNNNMISKLDPLSYTCNDCCFQTKYRGNLKKHLLNHKSPSELIMFKCADCGFEAKRKDYLKEHIMRHRGLLGESSTKFICPECTFVTCLKRTFDNHILKSHEHLCDSLGINYYKCQYCNYRSTNIGHVRDHGITHKQNREKPSPSKYLNCDSCEFKTYYKSSLKTHMLLHKRTEEIKTLKCNQCNFETKHNRSLRRHLDRHLSIDKVKTHQCDICGFVTRHRWSLKCHLKVHSNNINGSKNRGPSISYDVSEERKISLMSVKRETRKKGIICQSCGCSFLTQGSFERHQTYECNMNNIKDEL